LAVVAAVFPVQTLVACALVRRCGTLDPDPERVARLEYRHAAFAAKESAFVANNAQGTKEYVIPTHVFIVVADDGTKMADVPKATAERQLAALNDAYASATAGSGLKYTFDVKEITRVTGPDMCDQGNEAKMKQKLRKGAANTLNLYITDLSACGLLGYSSWPWDLAKKGVVMDGVVIHYDTLPGGNYRPYNMGRTTIHEVGHWLGLYHTFQVCRVVCSEGCLLFLGQQQLTGCCLWHVQLAGRWRAVRLTQTPLVFHEQEQQHSPDAVGT
jgi:hypothetical protein